MIWYVFKSNGNDNILWILRSEGLFCLQFSSISRKNTYLVWKNSLQLIFLLLGGIGKSWDMANSFHTYESKLQINQCKYIYIHTTSYTGIGNLFSPITHTISWLSMISLIKRLINRALSIDLRSQNPKMYVMTSAAGIKKNICIETETRINKKRY